MCPYLPWQNSYRPASKLLLGLLLIERQFVHSLPMLLWTYLTVNSLRARCHSYMLPRNISQVNTMLYFPFFLTGLYYHCKEKNLSFLKHKWLSCISTTAQPLLPSGDSVPLSSPWWHRELPINEETYLVWESKMHRASIMKLYVIWINETCLTMVLYRARVRDVFKWERRQESIFWNICLLSLIQDAISNCDSSSCSFQSKVYGIDTVTVLAALL